MNGLYFYTGLFCLEILIFTIMALFHITIEKVVVKSDPEIIELLKEIKCLVSNGDEGVKQEIMDKLNNAISDIKSTI